MRIAVVGASGLVGGVMLEVLSERNFPVDELLPVASLNSVGNRINFKGQEIEIVSIEHALDEKPDLALFSAGGSLSQEWAPRFAEVGCRVIDNSSAWRMDPSVPLVVPEINADSIGEENFIIANPNCSTIQLVMVLHPVHLTYGLKRVIVSTYQSVSGTGKKALDQLFKERDGEHAEKVYPHPIDLNCLPHCDIFLANDYTKEEMKLLNESRKILKHPSLGLSATAVRVPVIGGHSESVNVECVNRFDISELRTLLDEQPGLSVQDNPSMNDYPMPLFSKDADEVFVGRLRRDESCENAFNAWIVADNLRKGAATNAVQIAEYLVRSGLV